MEKDAVGLRDMPVCVGPCWAAETAENRAQHALYHSNESSPLLLCSFSLFYYWPCVWTRYSLLLYYCFFAIFPPHVPLLPPGLCRIADQVLKHELCGSVDSGEFCGAPQWLEGR